MRRHAMMGVVCGSARASPPNFVFLEELNRLSLQIRCGTTKGKRLSMSKIPSALQLPQQSSPRGVVTPLSH
jgi:hypothetical protein